MYTVPREVETPGHKRLAQLASMFAPGSYQRRNLQSKRMQDALDGLIAHDGFDVIQVESSQLAGFDFDPRALLIVDEHNIEYELLYRMYQTERSWLRRLYNWVEFKKFRREETATWGRVSGCLSTSAREEQIMRGVVPGTPILVAPNAVDVEVLSSL